MGDKIHCKKMKQNDKIHGGDLNLEGEQNGIFYISQHLEEVFGDAPGRTGVASSIQCKQLLLSRRPVPVSLPLSSFPVFLPSLNR